MLTSFRTVKVALVAAATLLLFHSSALAANCPTYTGKPKGPDGKTMDKQCSPGQVGSKNEYNGCTWSLLGVEGESYWYPKNQYPKVDMTFYGNQEYDVVIKVFFADQESVIVVVQKDPDQKGGGCEVIRDNTDAASVLIWKA